MPRTRFLGTGFAVPDRVVTNDDLSQMMDTSDEWIRTRTGIRERRWVREGETGVDLALAATHRALEMADESASAIDAIVYATSTPDHFAPGNGVFLQRALGVGTIPAIDIRTQCSGFVYALSVADAWVRTGQYRRVLVVGAEVQSTGMLMTTEGRNVSVIFADGAGAVVLVRPTARIGGYWPSIFTPRAPTPRSSGSTARARCITPGSLPSTSPPDASTSVDREASHKARRGLEEGGNREDGEWGKGGEGGASFFCTGVRRRCAREKVGGDNGDRAVDPKLLGVGALGVKIESHYPPILAVGRTENHGAGAIREDHRHVGPSVVISVAVDCTRRRPPAPGGMLVRTQASATESA